METNICKIKFRRGIEEGRKGITPEEGEPIFTTDTHRLCIGDGITKGGISITKVFTDTDTAKPVKGDFKYENNALYLYTSDNTSVAVGGVDSVKSKIGAGLIVEEDGTIKVQAGNLIDVNNKGVNVSNTLANAVTGIKDMETNISILSSTSMKSPLAPIYDDKAYTMYVNVDGKVNMPLKIDDIKGALTKVEGKNNVYTFTSNNTSLSSAAATALNLPENSTINFTGINNGCILNCDNSIKFDYTSATYISDYVATTTGEGANAITTYTLSTYEGVVPRFHVDSSGGTSSGDITDNSVTTRKIADGAVTESKLSSDLKDKINNSSSEGNINLDKIYPVGSIYMSVNDTNPSTLFGGNWEQIKDRFLLATGDTYSPGVLDGEATHTLTIDEMPSHDHLINMVWGVNNRGYNAVEKDTAFGELHQVNGFMSETGGNKPHNNMPPYLTVYIWKRIP